MDKISKIKKIIPLMLSVLFYFGQSYAQNVVSFSKLKERDNKLYLGDQVFSGLVVKTYITNQPKSISEVKDGLISGKIIEFTEDFSFISKAYRDTAEISRLNSQISFKSQELAQAIQDNDKAYKEQNDFLINEIGGIEKLQKLKEKDTEGKLNKKKKEIYNKYEQLFQTNNLCVRKSNDIQQQINNLNQQLKSENDKPNYIPKKALEYSILDGAKHGAAIIYDSNGNKIGEGSYINGKQNGKWVYYFSNGQKLGEGSFINGDESNKGTSGVPKNGRDGIWIFYFENGKNKENSSWKNGVLDGPYKYYYGFGQLKEEGVIKSDKVVGLVKQFYESGNKKALLNYSNGLQHGLQTKYHENGKLSEEISWKNGILEGPFKIYSNSGQLQREGHYYSGKLVGLVTEYYESGKKFELLNYQNGLEHGLQTRFYENGQIEFKCNKDTNSLAKNQLIGDYYAYNEDGSLDFHMVYYKDGKVEDKSHLNSITSTKISKSEFNKKYKCKCCKAIINGIPESVLSDGEEYSEQYFQSWILEESKINYEIIGKQLLGYNDYYDFLRDIIYKYCTKKCAITCEKN